jgi:hypothetical protein
MAKTKSMKTRFEYVVKFVCGSATREGGPGVQPVVKGEYATCINIHNPSKKSASFARKVATAWAQDQPGMTTGVSPFREVRHSMDPDGARTYHCANLLATERISGFAEGFMVIASPVELDVVAVYTARAPDGHITTLDIEEVQPKKRAKTITVIPR